MAQQTTLQSTRTRGTTRPSNRSSIGLCTDPGPGTGILELPGNMHASLLVPRAAVLPRPLQHCQLASTCCCSARLLTAAAATPCPLGLPSSRAAGTHRTRASSQVERATPPPLPAASTIGPPSTAAIVARSGRQSSWIIVNGVGWLLPPWIAHFTARTSPNPSCPRRTRARSLLLPLQWGGADRRPPIWDSAADNGNKR